MNLRNLDYKILLLSMALFCIGLICLYSSSEHSYLIFKNSPVIKQLFWILLSTLMFFMSFFLGYQKVLDFGFLFYLSNLIFLMALLMLAPAISGAQRWFNILGLNFQPSEFAKLSLILVLTQYFITRQERINKLQTFMTAFIFLSIYVFLIFQQPDLGSALILIPVFLIMVICAGIKKKYIIGFIITGVVFLPGLWFILKDYQKQRLLVFLNPNTDPLGAGYTIIQSKIAIGSGGLWGKGWLKGSQGQFNFLPESHTDFIFALLCEEGGFLLAVLVIFLYYLLIKRILRIALVANNPAARLLALAVATLIFSQVFVNIGMALGIMPVVGLPLPFISYGGSNLMTNMIALGLVASVEK